MWPASSSLAYVVSTRWEPKSIKNNHASASVIASGSPVNTLINYPQCEQTSSKKPPVYDFSLIPRLPICPTPMPSHIGHCLRFLSNICSALCSAVSWWASYVSDGPHIAKSRQRKRVGLCYGQPFVLVPQGIDMFGHLVSGIMSWQ